VRVVQLREKGNQDAGKQPSFSQSEATSRIVDAEEGRKVRIALYKGGGGVKKQSNIYVLLN